MMRVRPWTAVLTTAVTAFVVSLALPWILNWNDEYLPGATVLFSDDHEPLLGALLLALWATAVAGTVRRWWVAFPAAVAALAICPVYYAVGISRSTGLAAGRDAQGRFVEWVIQDRPAAGFVVAGAAGVLLCASVLLRRYERRPAPVGS
ncbi:hypothetical protein [Catenuloplanes japonicus]|uniref:hypothetical protein n=1 Tax=Catenuloplanes japonicus TaxID=33876 RepID=UPI0012FCD2D6|nr:hypothetical protein [Catenuloplanes japonicus]